MAGLAGLGPLVGKCALVTGSTSGIGAGVAYCLAKAGAHIVLHGLEKDDDPKIEELQKKIERIPLGRKPLYLNIDISQESGCNKLVRLATSEMGKIDILVNNAGVQYVAPVQDFPTQEWEKLIKVNLTAPFYLSREVLPQMYTRHWGRLIHIGSVHSLVGSVNKCAYVASKHGILGLSKVIALEAAGKGVTSNTICPGYVRTPLVQKQIDALAATKNIKETFATMQFLQEKQPSEQFVKVEEIGEFITFLCSEFSDQITGAAFAIDGGWTAR